MYLEHEIIAESDVMPMNPWYISLLSNLEGIQPKSRCVIKPRPHVSSSRYTRFSSWAFVFIKFCLIQSLADEVKRIEQCSM